LLPQQKSDISRPDPYPSIHTAQRPICGEGEGMPISSRFNEIMHPVDKKSGKINYQKPKTKD
jgi:hypothetical protein